MGVARRKGAGSSKQPASFHLNTSTVDKIAELEAQIANLRESAVAGTSMTAGDGAARGSGYATLSRPCTSAGDAEGKQQQPTNQHVPQQRRVETGLELKRTPKAAAKATVGKGDQRVGSTRTKPRAPSPPPLSHQPGKPRADFDLEQWLEETPPAQMLTLALCAIVAVALSLAYAEKDYALKHQYNPFLCNYGGSNIPGICPDFSSAKASTRYTPSGRRKKNTLPRSRTHAKDATAVPSTDEELYAKGDRAKELVPDISNTDWNIVLTRLETFIEEFTWAKTEDGRYDLSDHQGVMKPVYDTVTVFDAWHTRCPPKGKPYVGTMLHNIETGLGEFFELFKSFISQGHPVTNDQIVRMQERMGKLQVQFGEDIKDVRRETNTPFNSAIKQALDVRHQRAVSEESALPLGQSLQASTVYLNKLKKQQKKKKAKTKKAKKAKEAKKKKRAG